MFDMWAKMLISVIASILILGAIGIQYVFAPSHPEYVGVDPAVEELLKSVLGSQFAGR